jgi:hypothetical protein
MTELQTNVGASVHASLPRCYHHHPIIIFPTAAARALETVHGQRHGASLQRSTYVYAQLALSLAPLSATVRVLCYPIAHTEAGSRFVFWPHSGNGVTQREPGRDRLRPSDRKMRVWMLLQRSHA